VSIVIRLPQTDSISRVAEVLIASGCVYVCSWGEGCERVHDIVDEVCVGPDPSSDDDSAIMTTWHEDESLDEALWHFLNVSWPDDRYFDYCNDAVAITIGAPLEIQQRIDFALSNPREFNSQVLCNEEDGRR
jgi:hypothetical protein